MSNDPNTITAHQLRLSIIMGKVRDHETAVTLMKDDYEDSPAFDAIEAAADKLGEAVFALREAISALK